MFSLLWRYSAYSLPVNLQKLLNTVLKEEVCIVLFL